MRDTSFFVSPICSHAFFEQSQFQSLFGGDNKINLRLGTVGTQTMGLFNGRDANIYGTHFYLYTSWFMPKVNIGQAGLAGILDAKQEQGQIVGHDLPTPLGHKQLQLVRVHHVPGSVHLDHVQAVLALDRHLVHLGSGLRGDSAEQSRGPCPPRRALLS